MPIDFVGDWCSPSRDDDAKNASTYTLPSWTEDGHCTDILSIDKYGFYFVKEAKRCEPVNMRLTQNTAPSGTAYMATVTASCHPDGPVTEGKIQKFEFNRYKGHLTITAR